ncbi:N-(5'-phosphoribosyl)anthranilate isomerase [Aestuariivita sp.]|jgi:hypothetical protein|uniref:N-(5'-phosphoribosyl)anthranilate isomerase n=1 Tax=Aestuariivita sp. TaxID=1872407 RepID=UPI0021707C10|nr:N-(5'-phosphoribosyl)anthranilate isomerase [Aestuariivita sp.]MCE8008617.1 N-(5'-phosphoribosyl)anthranilate isomerase [Aestuariivita sp.]
MGRPDRYLSAEGWLLHLFSSKAACEGGVVRRRLADMERYVGRARFEAELHRRGYHAVENAGKIVVFCNQDPVRVLR